MVLTGQFEKMCCMFSVDEPFLVALLLVCTCVCACACACVCVCVCVCGQWRGAFIHTTQGPLVSYCTVLLTGQCK